MGLLSYNGNPQRCRGWSCTLPTIHPPTDFGSLGGVRAKHSRANAVCLKVHFVNFFSIVTSNNYGRFAFTIHAFMGSVIIPIP